MGPFSAPVRDDLNKGGRMEKYVCIGDIHGRNDLLQAILSKADSSYPEHRLLFLGDYVDRGPDTYEVLEEIKGRVAKGAIALIGNHEEFMLGFIAGRVANSSHPWLIQGNGGRKTIASYQGKAKDYSMRAIFRVPERAGHIQLLNSLPYYFETETIWASHAPIYKEDPDNFREEKELLTWNYFEDEENARKMGKLSICGHIHALSRSILTPRIFPQIVYADTGSGCAPWGPLSAVIIEDGEYKCYFQAIPETKEATWSR